MRRGILALLSVAAISLYGAGVDAQCTVANCPAGSNIVTSPPYIGTPGVDCFIGTAANDVMLAQGGDDFICGGGGSDTIFGGPGADTIQGEDGNDQLFGDGGGDFILGGDGADTIDGGDGNDFLFGEAGDDNIQGGTGLDFLDGGSEDDTLSGGDGADQLFGSDGADILRGDGDDDTLNGGVGNDQLFGGDGADQLSGGDGNDTLNGEAGDDPQLDGGAGEDTINGGAGNDTANGGPGQDFISGGPDNDTLSGGDGADVINGDDGDDTINGNGDNDTLDGGAGSNNQLFGDSGIDTCLNSANMDPSCENLTHATVEAFAAFVDRGSVVVQWSTRSEAGTVGFRVYRDDAAGTWEAVHDGTLSALLSAPQGGVYELRDDGPEPGESATYLLVEVDVLGNESKHGPFEVAARYEQSSMLEDDAMYAKAAHQITPSRFGTKALTSEKQGDGDPVAVYLGIEETGLYVVSAREIATRFGLDEATARARIQTGDVRLTEAGEPVAWSGSLDGAELLFYGLARKSLYTKERIYRLSLDSGTTMASESAAPGVLTPGLTYEAHVHLEEDVVEGVQLVGDPDSDYWFWQVVSARPTSPMTAEVTFDLEAVAGDGSLELDLHGISQVPHTVDVRLNGALLGRVVFDGRVPHRVTLDVPEAAIQDGENALTLEPVGLSDSEVILNFADLVYTRRYETGAASLLFAAGENASLEVEGLVGSDLQVLDVTDPRQPTRLTDAVSTPTGLQLATTANREYFASSRADARSPTSIWNDLPSDLRNDANAADYLVIAPAGFLDGARTLADHRQIEGLVSEVVDLQDVYDEFAFGTPDPNALRAFLRYSHDHWATPPEFVVLVGKGSFDYRDLKGYGGNFFSPIMAPTSRGLFSSDTKFADFLNDDGVPDVSIGRIPVSSASELTGVIDQIVAYEDAIDALQNDVAMLADATTEEGDFGAWADEATAGLPMSWSVAPIYRSDLGDLETTRTLLFDELQRGPRIFGYLGHAGLTALGKAEVLFSVDDLATLTIDGSQPIFADMTCVASRFATPGLVTLGESMLISEEAAIAVWGPSGVSINEQASVLLEGLLDELSAENHFRLGPMIDDALRSLDGSEHARDMLAIYHLFGDPALRVAKSSDVPGTGGSGGSSGSGGSAGTGGSSGTGGATPPTPRLTMAGCRAGSVPASEAGGAFLLMAALMLLAWRMRRNTSGFS